MRVLIVALAMALVLTAASCVPDFGPASQLNETVQVLAVRAHPPEVAPGESVRLDALMHWPGDSCCHLPISIQIKHTLVNTHRGCQPANVSALSGPGLLVLLRILLMHTLRSLLHALLRSARPRTV